MANQSLMIFLAFIIVLLTFSKHRCRVLPYIPIPIYHYRMEFLAFEALVDLLIPYLRPTTVAFVRPPIPVRKQVKLVLY